ncbi:unnamed protein product [Wickerhamomyces anomalus]
MVSFIDSALVLIITIHLFNAPFTKVEESFNIQAIHDLLTYGFDISKFDHTVFPGAVPRTFVGSLALAFIIKPVQWLIQSDITDLDVQVLVRGALGVINALGLIALKDSLLFQLEKEDKKDKKTKQNYFYVGYWYIIFLVSQFHITFYSSRTLPNFIALPLTNYALSKVIIGDYFEAISTLAFSTVVFRIELLALTLSIGFVGLLFKKVSLFTLVKSAIAGGVIGVVVSGAIDSFFWQRLTIPELESFIFNVIDGKSELWGTEPIYAYFTKYLLLIFLPPTVLALQGFGLFNDPTATKSLTILGISSFLYVSILSLQPHKEWRFIVYVVPVFTLVGANGASVITSRASKSLIYKIITLIIATSTLVSFAISVVWLRASSLNYPGGFALEEMNGIILRTQEFDMKYDNISVHIDVPACMTGVTLFGELNPIPGVDISYDKTEDPLELENIWSHFDFLISANPDVHSLKKVPEYEWLPLSTIKGFAGLNTGIIKSFNLEFGRSLLDVIIKSKSLEPLSVLFNSLFVQQDLLFIYAKVKVNSEESEELLKQLIGL